MFLQLGIFQWAFTTSGEYLDTKKGTRLNAVTGCTCSLVKAVLNHAFNVFCSLLLVSEFSISAFHMNRTHDGEIVLQAVTGLLAVNPGSIQEILIGANGLVPSGLGVLNLKCSSFPSKFCLPPFEGYLV